MKCSITANVRITEVLLMQNLRVILCYFLPSN